jgi:hypothetical protein
LCLSKRLPKCQRAEINMLIFWPKFFSPQYSGHTKRRFWNVVVSLLMHTSVTCLLLFFFITIAKNTSTVYLVTSDVNHFVSNELSLLQLHRSPPPPLPCVCVLDSGSDSGSLDTGLFN